jgi:hypothetical protein
MIKIRFEKTTYSTEERESPFYAHKLEGDKNIYMKFDEEIFYRIDIYIFGRGIFISTGRYGDYVDEKWYLYRSTKEEWEMALKKAKNYINNFSI